MANELYRAKYRYVEENDDLTVGELREQLALFDQDARIIFSETEAGNPMMFSRLKNRGRRIDGPDLVQIELIEVTDELARTDRSD